MLQSELVVPEQLMQFTLSQVSVAEVKWQILGGETFFRKAQPTLQIKQLLASLLAVHVRQVGAQIPVVRQAEGGLTKAANP